ncbi:boophilin-H2-like isoform X2 [Salvelinus namaycush]|uniref:Boophilin-H2-like isoform X2 n=1 Tax=Salvelinus namaycush TaxID=8040 RepID=A0A8U0PBR3_SALNM|nr:boophilin-H2-like isoform X2 [Salvelinus namaycush]
MANPLLHVFLLGVMLPVASSMKPFCSSKMDEGKAVEGKEDDKQLQYYYNEGKGACFPFFYKGLEGNENRFNTDMQCMKACSEKFEELYPAADGVCGLPVDHGSCFAMLLMHYYNAEEGNCRVFHYSGCQGNGNRFETREQCLQTCMDTHLTNCSDGSSQSIRGPSSTTSLQLCLYYACSSRSCEILFFCSQSRKVWWCYGTRTQPR